MSAGSYPLLAFSFLMIALMMSTCCLSAVERPERTPISSAPQRQQAGEREDTRVMPPAADTAWGGSRRSSRKGKRMTCIPAGLTCAPLMSPGGSKVSSFNQNRQEPVVSSRLCAAKTSGKGGKDLRHESADLGSRVLAEGAQRDGDEILVEHAPHEGHERPGRAERVGLQTDDQRVSRQRLRKSVSAKGTYLLRRSKEIRALDVPFE